MTSREQFEAWWTEDAPPVMHEMLLARNEFDEYAAIRCQCAWETWQAARAQALEQSARLADLYRDEHAQPGGETHACQEIADAIRSMAKE